MKLTELTITEAAELIKAREVSPVDLTEAHLARIERVDLRLNCFITLTADQALDSARRAEEIDALNKRSKRLVKKFVELHARLDRVADSPVEEILGHVLTESGYRAQFEASETEEDTQRLANIEETTYSASASPSSTVTYRGLPPSSRSENRFFRYCLSLSAMRQFAVSRIGCVER